MCYALYDRLGLNRPVTSYNKWVSTDHTITTKGSLPTTKLQTLVNIHMISCRKKRCTWGRVAGSLPTTYQANMINKKIKSWVFIFSTISVMGSLYPEKDVYHLTSIYSTNYRRLPNCDYDQPWLNLKMWCCPLPSATFGYYNSIPELYSNPQITK